MTTEEIRTKLLTVGTVNETDLRGIITVSCFVPRRGLRLAQTYYVNGVSRKQAYIRLHKKLAEAGLFS